MLMRFIGIQEQMNVEGKTQFTHFKTVAGVLQWLWTCTFSENMLPVVEPSIDSALNCEHPPLMVEFAFTL